MKHNKIVYTYFSRGLMEEEMMLDGLSLPDALAYVCQMAYIYCYDDFSIHQVYAETKERNAWAKVQDCVDIEYQRERYLAEKARRKTETQKEDF